MSKWHKMLEAWLETSKDAAQDKESKNNIKEFTQHAKQEWKQYKMQTDAQTGEIYDGDARRKMDRAMRAERRKRAALHDGHATWRKFVEYSSAQAAWEDFLYYQNVWNRKSKDWKSTMALETAVEKKAMQKEQSFRNDNAIAEGDSGEAKFELKDPILGTIGSETMKRMDGYPSSIYLDLHIKWIDHIIRIFKKFHLGYRKRMPATVGPDGAHRYTQPPRGTTPQVLSRFRKRHGHLEERFPRKRRRVLDLDEVEEAVREKSARQKDNELERKGQMIPISWETDEDRFRELRLVKESAIRGTANSGTTAGDETVEQTADTRTSYASDIRTRRLLPKEHRLHHGSTESSFDWPTSFESNDWGNTMSQTDWRKVPSYEVVSYSDDENDDEESIKKMRMPRYVKDDKGNMITRTSKGRYKRHNVKKPGKIFVFERNADGTVVGRDRKGEWLGEWVDGEVEVEEFVLDAEGQRVPETPKQIDHYVFQTTVVATKKSGSSRRGRHQDEGVTNQLSDDEGEQVRDPNFRLSGNTNPAQVGKPTNWRGKDRVESGQENSDGALNDENEENDDDGDLFRQSYEQGSGSAESPTRRHAHDVLARLHADVGIIPGRSIETIVIWMEGGLTDALVEAEYCSLYRLFQGRLP